MGEKHYRAKLTAEQVGRIKAMLSEDRLYMSEIALEFGVSCSTIHSIKSGKNWRGVTPSPLATVKTMESESGLLDQAIQESTISEDDL